MFMSYNSLRAKLDVAELFKVVDCWQSGQPLDKVQFITRSLRLPGLYKVNLYEEVKGFWVNFRFRAFKF